MGLFPAAAPIVGFAAPTHLTRAFAPVYITVGTVGKGGSARPSKGKKSEIFALEVIAGQAKLCEPVLKVVG